MAHPGEISIIRTRSPAHAPEGSARLHGTSLSSSASWGLTRCFHRGLPRLQQQTMMSRGGISITRTIVKVKASTPERVSKTVCCIMVLPLACVRKLSQDQTCDTVTHDPEISLPARPNKPFYLDCTYSMLAQSGLPDSQHHSHNSQSFNPLKGQRDCLLHHGPNARICQQLEPALPGTHREATCILIFQPLSKLDTSAPRTSTATSRRGISIIRTTVKASTPGRVSKTLCCITVLACEQAAAGQDMRRRSGTSEKPFYL